MGTRAWIVAGAVALFTTGAFFGCGSSAAAPEPDGGTGAAAADASSGTGSDSGSTTSDAGDAAASDTDAGFPIHHVVIVVKENHTFDNYFGSFPGANGTSSFTMLDGGTFPVGEAPDSMPRDLCHERKCALTDMNDGGMNGWENTTDSDQGGDHLAWAQYQESDIPNYWQYARTFTLGDNFFANVLGPSFPGHTFMVAAQA